MPVFAIQACENIQKDIFVNLRLVSDQKNLKYEQVDLQFIRSSSKGHHQEY